MAAENLNKIEHIEEGGGPEKISKEELLEAKGPQGEADQAKFEALMTQEPSTTAQATEATKTNILEEFRNLSHKTENLKTNPQELAAQAQDLAKQIGELKERLSTSTDVKLKGSVESLLNNKLSHISDYLNVALSKAGVEYSPPKTTGGGLATPIEKFLGMLTHAQKQLGSLGGEVSALKAPGKDISPVDLIAIQVKVHQTQQEVELFINLLSKALESTKTIMNVQV